MHFSSQLSHLGLFQSRLFDTKSHREEEDGSHQPEAIAPDWENREVSTGTAIMAVQFDGGMVLGADSRTTTGSYIAN